MIKNYPSPFSINSRIFMPLICLWLAITMSGLISCGNHQPDSDQKGQAKATVNSHLKTTAGDISKEDFQDAALKGNLSTVKKAVDQGLKVDNTDQYGRTPLMLASFNGHTKIIKFLLEEGASAMLKNTEDRTALMFAASGPFPKAVSLLLKAGADPNVTDNVEGWSALMFAAAEGQKEVVQILLDSGADPTLKDKDGDTALNFAKNNKHPNVVSLLQ